LKYNKPPLAVEKQIELLEGRGMRIPDKALAVSQLTHINYYRLRAYWLPMEVKADKAGEHKFKEGTELGPVLAHYEFDRKLRLLLLAAIERLEVSLRTRISQILSLKHGSHAHLKPEIFQSSSKHIEFLADLREEMDRSHEDFIIHYYKKYTDPDSPPIWVVTEVMSLGLISRFFENIKTYADRGSISNPYSIHLEVLASFLHHLTHVRNNCAHHCRVWNRKFVLKFKLPHTPASIIPWFNKEDGPDRKIYNTMAMLTHLMRSIDSTYPWFERFKELLAAHPTISKEAMGFPKDWEKNPLWK
jgi:abortive infection bacteriophage resistance protein